MELHHIEPYYINFLWTWNPDTQDESYSSKTPKEKMQVMIGYSNTKKVQYNQKKFPRSPWYYQRIYRLFRKHFTDELNNLYQANTMDRAFMEFMKWVRSLIIQYVTRLMHMGREHVIFQHEIFKTYVLKKFNYTVVSYLYNNNKHYH